MLVTAEQLLALQLAIDYLLALQQDTSLVEVIDIDGLRALLYQARADI